MDKSEQKNTENTAENTAENSGFLSKIKKAFGFLKNSPSVADSENDAYWGSDSNDDTLNTSTDTQHFVNPHKKRKKPSEPTINHVTPPHDDDDNDANDNNDIHDIEKELDALYASGEKKKRKKTLEPTIHDDINPYDNFDSDEESHKSPRQRVFYDKDNLPIKKINIIWVIIIFIGIVTSLLIMYLMWKAQSRPPLDISTESAKPELAMGEAKLETPILGTPEVPAEKSVTGLATDDPLSQIDFDFSVTTNNDIARMPMLPDKIKPKKAETPTSQFQDLWRNGTKTDEAEDAKNINSTNPKDFLPPWRRYSVDYQATNGRPVFSIILDYDPETLNVDDLPKNAGYNVVMAGFLEKSNQAFKALTDKKFEILLYLPMHEEMTRYTLRPIKKDSSFDDIREAINFHASLFNGKGFVGFMNYGGKEIQNILPKINFAMSVLAKTGYLYLDDAHDNTQSLAFAAAEGQKVPSLKTTNYINSVSQEFDTFIKHVKNDGTGVAIVKATPENIIALEAYDKTLADEKIHRIPLSGILKHQMLRK